MDYTCYPKVIINQASVNGIAHVMCMEYIGCIVAPYM